MELQWPLILFTTFIAWSAGLFAAQGIAAIKGEGAKAQMPALITSFVLMVIGGISVFFHLQHWERIFNGFGHLTSGITQELIAIVVLVIVMVIYFVYLRKDEEKLPSWLGVVAIVISAILVIVMGHSYMMASRPAWNNIVEILSLLGAACILGPATWAIIAAIKGGDEIKAEGSATAQTVFIGSIVNAVTTIAYVIMMAASSSEFTAVEYYFDPTSPTKDIVSTASASPFMSSSMAFTIIAIICALIPIIAAVLGKKKGEWKTWGAVALVCAVIACVLLRVVFYQMGLSVYPFYN
jgi:anaerobic dimethyl sulfoxide reductase subunit C (anchor subunit)